MRLEKKLRLWQQEKLITQKQQEAILSFEHTQKTSVGLYAVLGIAVFCIGLGVISLIASNWDAIPGTVKVGGAFLMFAAVLFGTFKLEEKGRETWFEASLTLGFILCGALIGLVAQVYHLIPQAKNGVLLWAVAALPVVLCSKHRLLSILWVPMMGYAVLDGALIDYVVRLFDGYPLTTTLSGIGLCALLAYGAFKVPFAFMAGVGSWAVVGMYLCVLAGEVSLYDAHRHVLPGFLLSVVFLSAMAFVCLKTNHMKAFNTNTLFIALRIVILYFQLFVSLAVTGIGLIVSGGVILALALAWKKMKRAVKQVTLGGKRA